MTPKTFTFVAVILAAFILLDIFMADAAAVRTKKGNGEPGRGQIRKKRGMIPMIIKPVCGSDGILYTNLHALKYYQRKNPALHEADGSKCPASEWDKYT